MTHNLYIPLTLSGLANKISVDWPDKEKFIKYTINLQIIKWTYYILQAFNAYMRIYFCGSAAIMP
jgi:hypothetical protein